MPASFKISYKSAVICLALFSASLAAVLATPTVHEIENAPRLEESLPSEFDGWKKSRDAMTQVSMTESNPAEPNINQPYDQSVLRTYQDHEGHLIFLAVAWAKKQRQEVKIHRPELCYPAQGLSVDSLKSATFPVTALSNGKRIVGKRMVAEDGAGRLELVSYWIRIGTNYSDNAFETRLHIFKEGLAGRIPDGILVRVSQRVPKDTKNLDSVFSLQEKFMSQLVSAAPASTREMLVR